MGMFDFDSFYGLVSFKLYTYSVKKLYEGLFIVCSFTNEGLISTHCCSSLVTSDSNVEGSNPGRAPMDISTQVPLYS